jgi:hypothetical protein
MSIFRRCLLALALLAAFAAAKTQPPQAQTKPPAQKPAANPLENVGSKMGVGFYSAIWPFIDEPLSRFQIGLPSTWTAPENSDGKDLPRVLFGPYARDSWPDRRAAKGIA